MRKIVLTLEEHQMAALEALAKREYRNPWQQGVLIINQELEKQGLVEPLLPAGVTPETAECKSSPARMLVME
jgi:hypothetical protein